MKPNYRNRFLAALRGTSVSSAIAAGFIAITIVPSHSATLTWDISPGTVGAGNGTITGGAGNWDTTPTLGNWTADAGANNVAWNNATLDGAVFTSTGGTVTQAGVAVNNITFNSTGYTVTGGTLTMGGAAPKITTNSDATVSSILGGTAGLTKDGSGVLSIPTKATYTGGTIVNAGVLNLTGGGDPGMTGAVGHARPLVLRHGVGAVKSGAVPLGCRRCRGCVLRGPGSPRMRCPRWCWRRWCC